MREHGCLRQVSQNRLGGGVDFFLRRNVPMLKVSSHLLYKIIGPDVLHFEFEVHYFYKHSVTSFM